MIDFLVRFIVLFHVFPDNSVVRPPDINLFRCSSIVLVGLVYQVFSILVKYIIWNYCVLSLFIERKNITFIIHPSIYIYLRLHYEKIDVIDCWDCGSIKMTGTFSPRVTIVATSRNLLSTPFRVFLPYWSRVVCERLVKQSVYYMTLLWYSLRSSGIKWLAI